MFVWLLVVPLIWLVAFRYRRRRMYELAARMPAPKQELPLIGIAHLLTGTTEDIMERLKEFSRQATEDGGMSRGWFLHKLYFLTTDPVDFEVLLKTCLEKDDMRKFVAKVIDGGIFAPVSIWRPRRKILMPVFSPKIVESFVRVFAEQSMKLAGKLAERAGAPKFSAWPFLSSYTLDAVCETTLGVKINAQDDNNVPFLVGLTKVLQLTCQRMFQIWLQPDWLYQLLPQYHQHQECLQIVHGFAHDVIMKKREELKEAQSSMPTEANREFDLSDYSNKSFLDFLIHFSGGENGYTNLELREEIMTLTVAGTDTSAAAVGYTLKMMAKYPHIQKKVLEELDEVFGDSHRLFVKEDLLQLTYLERVIKETLRMFPPVPFIVRKVEEEISLPSGRVLPAGCNVIVSIWGTHRNPKYWGPDAEKFDPDRFLPERFSHIHPNAFVPFSSGPRNCVGYKYALMSIKIAMSSVLRYNRVVSDTETNATPQIRVKLDVMMKDVDGFEIALEKRRPHPNTVHKRALLNKGVMSTIVKESL